MPEIQCAILDVGGVLIEEHSSLTQQYVADALNVDDETLKALWKEQIPLLGSGQITEVDFWQRAHNHYGGALLTPEANPLGKPFADNLEVRTDVMDLVGRLGENGIQLAVLSDTIAPHANAMRQAGVFEPFHHVFLSYETGYRKPDPHAYQFALNTIGVAAHKTIFLDDKVSNVAAANQLGITGIHASSTKDVIESLTNYI